MSCKRCKIIVSPHNASQKALIIVMLEIVMNITVACYFGTPLGILKKYYDKYVFCEVRKRISGQSSGLPPQTK